MSKGQPEDIELDPWVGSSKNTRTIPEASSRHATGDSDPEDAFPENSLLPTFGESLQCSFPAWTELTTFIHRARGSVRLVVSSRFSEQTHSFPLTILQPCGQWCLLVPAHLVGIVGNCGYRTDHSCFQILHRCLLASVHHGGMRDGRYLVWRGPSQRAGCAPKSPTRGQAGIQL